MEHAEQHELPAYVASRLDATERQRFESHLERCESCAAIVETWLELAPAFEGRMEDLMQPHPEPAVLQAIARGGAPGADAVERHIEHCARCALEVDAWRRRERARAALPRARPSYAALAAAVLLGVALSVAAWLVLAPRSGGELAGRGGPAALLVLESALRQDGIHPRYSLAAGQSFVPLAVHLRRQDVAGGEARYVFEIRDTEAVVQRWELDAAAVLAQLERSDVVTFVMHAERLGTGLHRMVVGVRGEEDRSLLDAPFVVERPGD